MYAIETKKRKFDRILESIKDHSTPPNTAKLPARDHNISTISLVPPEESSESLKRQKIRSTIDSQQSGSNVSPASHKTANFLPASREAFLERLETFGPVTKWHTASNEVINAAEWAKRGWRCVSTDTVQCGSCKERLLVTLDGASNSEAAEQETMADDTTGSSTGSVDDDYAMELEVHDGVVKKYQELIISAHGEGCPWRRRGCIESIQRIDGLLNGPAALAALQTRYDSIMNQALRCHLPTVMIDIDESEPYAALVRGLSGCIDNIQPKPATNAYLLAMCGWQSAADSASEVIECHHCFRHLGLWLYRGDEPTMRRLDALASHLEYCPWISKEVQATEFALDGKKTLLPGWVLVAQKIHERYGSIAGQASSVEKATAPEDLKADDTSRPRADEKERETKVKDLLRRMKELKKPFNVKGLLKKNKKAK